MSAMGGKQTSVRGQVSKLRSYVIERLMVTARKVIEVGHRPRRHPAREGSSTSPSSAPAR